MYYLFSTVIASEAKQSQVTCKYEIATPSRSIFVARDERRYTGLAMTT